MNKALYARVSKEVEDGFSIDAQRRILQDYCRTQNWDDTIEYIDADKPARSDSIEKRPAFKRMLEDAEDGLIDVVLVHKIDRFARNIRLTFECLERLARHGVSFVAVAQPDLDYTRPEGRLFMGMMATLAQYYSDNLSQETTKGKTERKLQGLHNGHIPFGMMRGPDGIAVADPATIAGLLLAFDLSAGGRSDREVAEALNAAGYRTTGVHGGAKPFTKDTIRPMLQNRFYLGELPGEGPDGPIAARHAAVIDLASWEAAQEARERRGGTRSTRVRRDATVYSLSGLAVCDHCGGRLRIQPNKGKPRLFCSTRQQRGGCCFRSAFLALYEEQIATHLATFTIPENYRERLRVFALEESRKSYVDDAVQRHRLEGQLERLRDLYKLGDIERPRYMGERDRVRRELAILTARQTEESNQLDRLAELLTDLQRGWLLATQEERSRLATLVFEEVVINDNRVVAVKPRPELAGFFAIDCQVRGQEVHRGGSDGARTRGLCLDRAAC